MPMIPNKLTARPRRTTTNCIPTEWRDRLRMAITKPSRVTTSPTRIIVVSSILRVFKRLALLESSHGNTQKNRSHEEQQDAPSLVQGARQRREPQQETTDSYSLSGICRHGVPPLQISEKRSPQLTLGTATTRPKESPRAA